MFGAEVVLDDEVAGARNVLLRLGSAYINFYDQPPKDTGRGVVHHLGIRTTDLAKLVNHMKSRGFEFARGSRRSGGYNTSWQPGPTASCSSLFETDRF